MKIVTSFDQRTPAWHAWRDGIIGGSDAPAIMGVSPWTTIHKLWELKTGRREPQRDNPAMARGRAMEDEALEAWSAHTGEFAAPICVQHEEFAFVGASLDGATFDGGLLVEIKCPGEKDHGSAAETGQVPAKYWPQVQHQLACVPEAEMLHYWSYRPMHATPHVLIEVKRDQAYIDDMLEREILFWEAVKGDYPPAGDAWADAEALYLLALDEAESADERLKAAKADLLAAIPEGTQKLDGQAVSAALVEKKGSLDYKALFEKTLEELRYIEGLPSAARELLDAMESGGMEAFRKKGSTYWDVRRKKR